MTAPRFCTNCAAPLPEAARFCASCAAPVAATEAAPPLPEAPVAATGAAPPPPEAPVAATPSAPVTEPTATHAASPPPPLPAPPRRARPVWLIPVAILAAAALAVVAVAVIVLVLASSDSDESDASSAVGASTGTSSARTAAGLGLPTPDGWSAREVGGRQVLVRNPADFERAPPAGPRIVVETVSERGAASDIEAAAEGAFPRDGGRSVRLVGGPTTIPVGDSFTDGILVSVQEAPGGRFEADGKRQGTITTYVAVPLGEGRAALVTLLSPAAEWEDAASALLRALGNAQFTAAR